MMLPLRLCYLTLNCLFDEPCKLSTSPSKDFTDTLVSGFNVSLVRKPFSLHSPTDDEDKAIDECLQSIERNESDTILLPYTMPVIGNNIKTGPVFFADKIAIVSTYGIENDTANLGILDTFDAFGVDAIALILNFIVILAALILLTYILERNSSRRRVRINSRRFNLQFVPWFIFRFFVKQFSCFPGNITALKVLLTCCLLTFSHFVTFFYVAMIKTDMVTVKAPRVIASYQDMLDNSEIEPYIHHLLDEYTSFKQAPLGSLKGKIWERILKMGVNRLVYNDSSENANLVYLMRPEHLFMQTKAAIMVYASTIDWGKYVFALHLKNLQKFSLHFKSLDNRKTLTVSDSTESERLSTSIINRMTSVVISDKYEVQVRCFFEGHFWYKMSDNGGLQNAQFYADMTGLGKDTSDVDQYVNQRVLLAEPVLLKMTIIYFMNLYISYFVLCVIEIIVFLIERWVSDKE